MAHHIYLDNYALIYAMIGNGIFSFAILFLKAIVWLFDFLWNGNQKRSFLDFILDTVIFVFTFLMTIAMALGDRKAERRADEYAIKLGYGEDLVEALYLLEKISLSSEKSILDKLLARHPRITARIENLEIGLGIQEEEDE